MSRILANRYVWLALALAVAVAGGSPATALLAGAALALLGGNPRATANGGLGKHLLQAAVVCLGFGVGLDVVLEVGTGSVGVTALTIAATMGLALGLARLMRVEPQLATLLGGGTAICGGSAIAAIAPAIGAATGTTAAALAIVFLLNALGLLVFPALGGWLNLSQEQFGLWSALAIHDTSSVVGAAAVYGPTALAVATTVKLVRALWILPLALACARRFRGRSGAQVPWFLVGFLLAACGRWYWPQLMATWDALAGAGRHLMVMTLFLIGSGLTRDTLRRIGLRPLAMAVVLWLLVAVGTLAAISRGWLSIDLPQ